jgi:hypothetical protein
MEQKLKILLIQVHSPRAPPKTLNLRTLAQAWEYAPPKPCPATSQTSGSQIKDPYFIPNCGFPGQHLSLSWPSLGRLGKVQGAL